VLVNDMARTKAMLCEACVGQARTSMRGRYVAPVKHKMKRIYVKNRQRSWTAIGWVCLWCGNLVMDASLKMHINHRRKEFDAIAMAMRGGL
jgi:hypothetical protein